MTYATAHTCARMKVPGVAKNVLMQLAMRADVDGRAFPGIESLCEYTGWSRRPVIEGIKQLEKVGAIKADRSNGRNTVYWVTPEKFKGDWYPERDSDQYPSSTSAATAPVLEQHDTGAATAPDPCCNSTLIPINANESNTPLPPNGGEGGFESFEAIYPRRVGIKQARKVWDELAPNAQQQSEIVRGLRGWIPSPEWQRESGRFVPKPANWLRDRRWMDAPGTAPPPKAAMAEQPSPSKAAPIPPDVRARIDAILASRGRARAAPSSPACLAQP